MPCFISFFHYIGFVSCYSPMLLTWNFNHELLVQTRAITCCKCRNVLHNHICPSFQQNHFILRSVECAKQCRIITFSTSVMDVGTKVKVAWLQGKKVSPRLTFFSWWVTAPLRGSEELPEALWGTETFITNLKQRTFHSLFLCILLALTGKSSLSASWCGDIMCIIQYLLTRINEMKMEETLLYYSC